MGRTPPSQAHLCRGAAHTVIPRMLCTLPQDDMEAFRTQNRFLNSEIHQVTKIWRKVAEKQKALLTKVSPSLSVPTLPGEPPTLLPYQAPS